MDFARLAEWCERLEATPSRLDTTRILVEALDAADVDELRPMILLLQGRVALDWEGIELGMAEKLVIQALARAAGLDAQRGGAQEVTKAYHATGDLGKTAQDLLSGRTEGSAGPRQVGLGAFGQEDAGPGPSPTVSEVHARLLAIALRTGSGSQEDKQQMLVKLLTEVDARAAKYVVRIALGRLRLGVADMTVLDALTAWHLGRGVRSVTQMEPDERREQEALRVLLEHAFDLRSDLGVVAETLARGGPEAVAALRMEPGVPLRPMAAERLKTLPEVFEKQARPVNEAGQRGVGMDYKYDGLRIQAHVTPTAVHLFSRRLEDLTSQFPDIVAALRASFPGRTLIVEGEAVALDEAGRMRPFQDISRRRGRKEGLGQDVTTLGGQAGRAGFDITKEIPVTMFLFDVLHIDGQAFLAASFAERRAALDALVASATLPGPPAAATEGGAIRASTYRVALDVADMESFFQEAVEDGAEGIMCKQLDAPYKAGSRGFAWIKFKTDYTQELVDTMDLVAIGAFYGRGRRAGWYGALLCAARDAGTGTFQSVCKLGTGFDDATLTGLKERFEAFVTPESPADVDSAMAPDVWFEPRVVLEVQAAELSLSPVHRAGFGRIRDGAGLAARFPRFTRWRDDKAPAQATSVDELVAMYEAQG